MVPGWGVVDVRHAALSFDSSIGAVKRAAGRPGD